MASLLGSGSNQVSVNGDLGTLAFQDSHAVNITGGIINVSTVTGNVVSTSITTGTISGNLTGNVTSTVGNITTLTANSIFGGTSYNLISSMALIHSNVAKANDTIPENVNALTLLPISIPTGTSVTVGSGSTWNFLDLS